MTTREPAAIRFDHYETFVDFVRQYGRAERQGAYALHECVWAALDEAAPPDEPERVYLLTRQDKALPNNPVFFHQTVELDPDGRHVWMLPGRRHRKRRLYRIVHQRQADRLPSLVGPVAGTYAEAPPIVVFWFDDDATFQQVVSTSFQLGCDRLQAAALTIVGDGGRRRVFLLRAERPSYFIVDEAIAHPSMKVFAPQGNGELLVPYGTVHPLADLWDDAPGRLVAMDGERGAVTLHELGQPEWTDIYGLTRFTLDGLVADDAWSNTTDALTRFTIPLTLIPAHKKRDVQIWMLAAHERDRLERLLTMIPEEDLHVLQFTAQTSPAGEERLFVRERHTGVGREYIDFEGVEFAPFAGYPNLLLPVDMTLEPPLRKDRYREIFKLRPRELVFLWDAGDGPRLARLAESSFRPLPELVDYIVSAASETLKALEAQAVFDFFQYEAAPRRPRPVASKDDRAGSAERPDEDDDGQEDVEVRQEARKKPEAAPAPRVELAVPEPVREEVKQSDLELQEIEREREVIVVGQTVERWIALAAVKQQLDKPDDEALCHAEALWLTFVEQADAEPVRQRLVAAFERVPEFQLGGLSRPDRARRAAELLGGEDAHVGWLWLHVHYELARIKADEAESRRSGELREFLNRAYTLLDRGVRRMRFKDRWLLWRQLITLNHDGMQEAKIREHLLLDLTQNGLQPFDIPHFIQNRIYQSRFIDDHDAEGENEFLVANAILDSVASRIERANDEVLRRIGAAILAYGFERLGNRGRAEQYYVQAEGFFDSATGLSHIEQAWIALYLGAARELQGSGGGKTWVNRYNQKIKQHASADLAHSELEVLQASIFKRAESSSPSEFFTPDNFRSLFPTSGKYTEAQQIKRELDELINAGKFNQALADLRELARRAMEGNLKLDARQFAWLLGPITDALRRIGQAVEGVEILAQFEQSVDRIKTRNLLGLYNTLLRLKLAEGYLDLGEEQRGTELIQLVVSNAYRSQNLQWLDHLDMLGAGLEAIEVVPLGNRAGAVEEVLNALFVTESHPQDSVNYRPIKLRLLDHCVEVALSKEKLSLKRYKLYLDEDEFHVRYRIVNDHITE